MIVTTLSRLKEQVPWPYPRLCKYLALPYASFRRWKHRIGQGQPALFQPGPKKMAPLNVEELHVHLCCLQHGRQRSRGVGRLYRHYQDQISRRDLQALTETVRRELAQQRQAELRHITWQVPGLVWSLDDAELVGLPATNCICIKCRTWPPDISSPPGWESGSWEKAWPLAWSNCSCGKDRRWCSNATTVPISIIRPSMRCWPVIG